MFNITTEPGTFEVYAKPTDNTVTIPSGETTATITQADAGNGKFIPRGSVFKKVGDNYILAPKNDDGSFTVNSADYVFNSFDLPSEEIGITTFGASDFGQDTTTVRFGSYSLKNDGNTSHGTMVFEGNWLLLMNYYIKHGYSVQDLVNMIYQDFETTLNSEGNKGKTFVYYNVPKEDGNGTEKINVYKFEQSRYFWKNETDKILEYGLQITNVQQKTTYAAVAYSHKTGNKLEDATVSAEVKSITKSAAN